VLGPLVVAVVASLGNLDGAAVGLALVMTLGLVWLVAVVGETST